MGSGHIFFLNLIGENRMRFVRFSKSEAIFARTLLEEIPTLTVKTKVFINIVADISSALFRGRKEGAIVV